MNDYSIEEVFKLLDLDTEAKRKEFRKLAELCHLDKIGEVSEHIIKVKTTRNTKENEDD